MKIIDISSVKIEYQKDENWQHIRIHLQHFEQVKHVKCLNKKWLTNSNISRAVNSQAQPRKEQYYSYVDTWDHPSYLSQQNDKMDE